MLQEPRIAAEAGIAVEAGVAGKSAALGSYCCSCRCRGLEQLQRPGWSNIFLRNFDLDIKNLQCDHEVLDNAA